MYTQGRRYSRLVKACRSRSFATSWNWYIASYGLYQSITVLTPSHDISNLKILMAAVELRPLIALSYYSIDSCRNRVWFERFKSPVAKRDEKILRWAANYHRLKVISFTIELSLLLAKMTVISWQRLCYAWRSTRKSVKEKLFFVLYTY